MFDKIKYFFTIIDIIIRYFLFLLSCLLFIIYIFFPDLWDTILLQYIQNQSSLISYIKTVFSEIFVEPVKSSYQKHYKSALFILTAFIILIIKFICIG